MNKNTAHNSKEFFIDGEMFLVRPLEPTDKCATKTCKQLLNEKQFVAFGRVINPDVSLVDYLADTDESYIFIALSQAHSEPEPEPVGVAIYEKNPATGVHEMTVLATEQHIDSRLVYELAESLIQDAYNHDVVALYTTGNSDDRHLTVLAKKLGMSLQLVPGNSSLVKYTLQVDKHPSITSDQ